jgi:AAA domain
MTEHPSGLRIQTPDLALARPPRFAWEGRIVIGYLNLLLGNEGVGKGTLVAWLCAMWSLGRLPGDLYGEPVNVGIIALEDSFNDVWVPRLHAAGADLKRIRLLERPDGGVITGKEDRDKLAIAVDLEQLRVVFCDQMSDNLGAVNDWRNKELRDGLQPWRWLGRELDIPLIGSLHPNKKAESFRQLVSGASGFNAISRSSLLLAEHPEDESRRVLVRGKGNLAITPPAVEFEIATHRFEANGHLFSVPKATGFTDGDVTVDELIEAAGRPTGPSSVGDATDIIRSLIPGDGAWHPAAPVYETCAREQVNERTVQRAFKRLGLERQRAREFQAAVEWRWPSTGDKDPTCIKGVGSVGSANSTCDTHDTYDTHDIKNIGRDCVGSGNGAGPPSLPSLPFDLDLTPPSKPAKARRCVCDKPILAADRACTKCGRRRPGNALTADCEVA